jgi:hypothetical protein
MGNITADPDTDHPQFRHVPFGAEKTAPQFVQLSVNPSQGLTRKRYSWWSNGTRFDETLVSETEAGVRVETSGTATDTARLRSAYAGQYLSQAEAAPGLGLVVDAPNVTITDGAVSLSHGTIHAGAFYYDTATGEPETGVGFTWDTDGWRFFVKSLGSHIGPSPVPQSDFGVDAGDGDGHSGQVVDPSEGYVWNWPHTWYNEGPLSGAWLNPTNNQLEELVRVSVEGRPSTDTANFPIQVVVDNDGTGDPLGVEVGGVQYTTYGAGREDLERRKTVETRVQDSYITPTVQLSNNAIDPTLEPGVPVVAAQRKSDHPSLNLRATELEVQPTPGNIWVMSWDEYEPGTALDGSFNQPVSPNNAGQESNILTNTTGTDYTPSTAVLRGLYFFEGGQDQKIAPSRADADLRVPLDATRVYTAALAQGANDSGTNPFNATFEEGF